MADSIKPQNKPRSKRFIIQNNTTNMLKVIQMTPNMAENDKDFVIVATSVLSDVYIPGNPPQQATTFMVSPGQKYIFPTNPHFNHVYVVLDTNGPRHAVTRGGAGRTMIIL